MDMKQRSSMCASVLEATQAADKSTTSVNDHRSNNMERNLKNSSPSTPKSKHTQIETHHMDAEVTTSDCITPCLERTATPSAQLLLFWLGMAKREQG